VAKKIYHPHLSRYNLKPSFKHFTLVGTSLQKPSFNIYGSNTLMIIFKENYIILIFQANTQPISWSFPRKYMTHVIKKTLHT
jgi:hypothetical protein